ncbi:hypothetical protein BV25DRAFT_1180421 [Artomyces pyxidatus]|uniref:Uncharacterized protein n=1 Tax=Artomyces pyxidatus TaxID=48021 RepID=A0ACB8SRE6_9AGAM|nr:hypothetical protein BV25DRAFT_1180421 [Artomyces pyxidatus]
MPVHNYRISHPHIINFPTNVLQQIFCHLVEPEPPRSASAPSWVPVTQVCRQWRRIGYGCKALWTKIPLWSRPWTEVAIARSRPLPISLHWYSNSRRLHVDTLRRALAELPRVCDLSLDLRNQPGNAGELLFITTHSLEAWPTLCMEKLTLLATDETFHLDCLPPTLRALKLQSAVLPLATLHACHALRELEVESSELWLTLAEMVDALAHLPLLEVLHVGEHVVPHDVDPFPTGERRPRVPLNLRSLQLYGTPSKLLYIVHSLAIPPACAVLLEFVVAKADRSEATAAVATVGDLFYVNALGEPPFEWLYIEQSPSHPGQIHLSATSNALSGRSLLMGLSWPSTEEVSDVMLAVLPVFRGVRQLTMIHAAFMSQANWVGLSWIMPNLAMLTVWGDNEAHALLSAFETARQHNFSMFPVLHKLNMLDTAISQPREGERNANPAALLEGVRRSRCTAMHCGRQIAVRLHLSFKDATYVISSAAM